GSWRSTLCCRRHVGLQRIEEFADDHIGRWLDDAAADAGEHTANIDVAGIVDGSDVSTIVLEAELAFAIDLSLRPLALDMHREAVRAILISDADLAVVCPLDHRDTHRHRGVVFVRTD